jgi:hypothetical protein
MVFDMRKIVYNFRCIQLITLLKKITQPIIRPRDDCYTERWDGFCRTFVVTVNDIRMHNISKLDALSRMLQTFDNYDVHLTLKSGHTLVNVLLYTADSLFTVEVIKSRH